MRELDITIVGAGIAGASLAWRLAGPRSVLLLERESQPGYHSTGRSAAMFMESYGPTVVRALTRASRAFYAHPPAGFSDVALLAPRGALYVATPATVHLLEETRAALLATGSEVQTLSAQAALDMVSCLRPEQLAEALFEPGAQDIDANALHQGFLRGFRQRGGELRTSAPVTAARRDGDAWLLQLADGQQLRTRTVVSAAGAWADELGRLLNAPPIGLVPARRSAFTFRPPAGTDVADWPAVAAIDESFYFKPDAGQLLGSPANADPTHPHDVLPEDLDIATGIHHIETMTTLVVRRPTATWAGLRSFVADGELVIGWDPACTGLFWLAAQGGYGIQSAAGASELAAALLLGTALPAWAAHENIDAATLSPARLR